MQPTTSVVNSPDVQAQRPTVHVSLSRVGVTNVEKVIRISRDGQEELYWAKLECFVDLGPQQKGAHMSRFEETVNDAIGEVILGSSAFRAEDFAARIAELVRDRQERSEEHTSELQSQFHLVCRLLLEKKKTKSNHMLMPQ